MFQQNFVKLHFFVNKLGILNSGAFTVQLLNWNSIKVTPLLNSLFIFFLSSSPYPSGKVLSPAKKTSGSGNPWVSVLISWFLVQVRERTREQGEGWMKCLCDGGIRTECGCWWILCSVFFWMDEEFLAPYLFLLLHYFILLNFSPRRLSAFISRAFVDLSIRPVQKHPHRQRPHVHSIHN